ncbi:enhancer of polycomb-like transcription factor protein [Trifolium pratense]|uniref:Enhancer of polycomb-like protein n=1 Tax=Trifolium pratense TaxID=57577 RepID=A0A2K3N6Z9_TRIPR|nr:enhancer of polycomb-like transcription factor protein [Trifolium pratense]
MPAAGMRRSTRVFGVVMKGSDSGRVLRSGRRLFPEQSVDDDKTKGGNEGDDWPKPQSPSKENTRRNADVAMAKTTAAEKAAIPAMGQVGRGGGIDRMYGIAYSRKRRRTGGEKWLKYSRRKRGVKVGESSEPCVFSVVVKPCARKNGRFSSLLVSVLRYMTRFTVTLPEVLAFFLSQPIHVAFASQGVQFLQGSPPANTGICRFFGITDFIPLFSVDFSAVPVYFEYLHSSRQLDFLFRSFFIVHNPITAHSDDEDDEKIDLPEYKDRPQISCDTVEREPSESGTVIPDVIEFSDSLSLPSSVKGPRLAGGRNGQFRSVLNSRFTQKRRSSLRKRKAHSPFTMNLRRCNGLVASDLMGGRKRNIQFSAMTPTKRHRSLANEDIARSLKEASSSLVDSTKSVDSSLCSANILVIETDRCYRQDGAIVTLEMSASREWLLTVKRDGLTRCTFKAEKVMRPWSSSRFTQAIMVSLDNGWKLEFANRNDWIIFKDLYKQCSDRNIPGPVAKSIPVPGVHGVSSYAETESNDFPFQRPATYISVLGDEITRAMARRTANYDMDSEDEEWLSKLNNEFQEHVSEDNFELIIDAFEKVYYCNPDDSFDVKSAASCCQDLGSKEVVEAVYTYWMNKRKQKRSLLIRVFQFVSSQVPTHSFLAVFPSQ